MTDKITIEIDGRDCEAAPGEMIIAVADREGIVIPRFCYHKKLSIAANCRMCLVEAEQGGRPFPKPVPACATPVGNGMKVWTRSPKAISAQKGTMEFLLINHPLDCPICDQGGECELQDVAMGYGGDVSRFCERKRIVKDEDLGPLISTDMTRCIHCTRCVRFAAEIAGVRELGATGRGEDMRIGTFVAQAVHHELSGNIIDLCPVGALTSKPYRYTARAWELTARDGVAPHDGLGSNVQFHIRNQRLMRVHPRENDAVNETWISDRDRFSYLGLYSDDRLTAPLVKRDGAWQEVGWEEALTLVAERLKAADAADMGWLVAPTATLEELYLAQRIARGLGCNNIDHRLRQQDFSGDDADPALPWLGLPVEDLESQTSILVVGSDVRHEQPLLAHRIRQAALNDARVSFVNPLKLDLNHPSTQLIGTPAAMCDHLAGIARSLGVSASGVVGSRISSAEPTEAQAAVAAQLKEAGQGGVVLLGALAAAHPQYALLKALCYRIADAAGCRVGYLAAAANSVGAYLAGAHPRRLPGAKRADTGRTAAEMLAAPSKVCVLWGVEPGSDLANPAKAQRALAESDFVIACSAFRSADLESVADVLLPIGTFAETSGTFVNTAGVWQRFQGAVPPPGEARPGWKVLRVLGNLVDLTGFDYADGAQVRDELAAICADLAPDNSLRGTFEPAEAPSVDGLTRVGTYPVYAVDPLVRRSSPLQQMPMPGSEFAVYLHPDQAAADGLSAEDVVAVRQSDGSAEARVIIDHRIPLGCARIPAGVAGSEGLGDLVGPVSLERLRSVGSAGADR